MEVQKIPQTWRDLPQEDCDYAAKVMLRFFELYDAGNTGRSPSEKQVVDVMINERGWTAQYAKLAYDGGMAYWVEAYCG
jgi:hypothetical protein